MKAISEELSIVADSDRHRTNTLQHGKSENGQKHGGLHCSQGAA
jgi:hypothetical protein